MDKHLHCSGFWFNVEHFSLINVFIFNVFVMVLFSFSLVNTAK